MSFLVALLLGLQAPSQSSDTTHLVIVATTDIHGRVFGWDYVRDAEAPGGLSRAATILETLRTQYPGRLVLVDAGDLLQGNPFATFFGRQDQRTPQPIVDALNALQYDAATPGNHDFDFGLPLLRRAGVEATYHYVAANVDQTSGGPLTTVSPYNGTSHTVGAESSTAFAQMFATSAAIAGGTATANVQVKAPGTAPAANDYNEVFTFIASASF